jgi:ABC-type bacteriocin/lantibiotic exporter with double-glycine peptidase domain
MIAVEDHAHEKPSHGSHEHHGPSPLKRLWSLLRVESRDLWLVGIFATFIGILSLAVPIAIDILVSNVQGGNEAMLQVVIVLALALFCLLALAGAMRALSTFVVELIQRRIFVRIVDVLAQRLPRIRASAFDRQHGPELVNRFFDVLTVQKAGATLILDGLSVLLQGAIGLIVLAIWHPYLLGFNLALLVAMTLVVWLLGFGAIRAKISESYAKYAVAGWLEEMVRHPLAFKLSAGQDYAMEKADGLTRHYLDCRVDSFRILFRQILFGLALQAIASSALLGLGGYLVVRNELTLGQLVAAELIVLVLVGSFVKLGKSLESYYDLMAAMDKLGHLVDLPLERDSGESLPAMPRPAALELRHVCFSYEEGGEVLSGLSAAIRAGERVAIVGESGAGKSTLVDLLLGLREPTSGHIEIDGSDVRDLRLHELREQVVSVASAEVFEGTILDNVSLRRPDVTTAEVRAALRTVSLLDEVQALPQGLHTPLVTGGAPLSQGQTLRLMLARAIAGRPRLLILDEALDPFSRQMRQRILSALFDRQAGWTLLVVTHDQEIITACDRVLEVPAQTRPDVEALTPVLNDSERSLPR